MLRPYFLKKTFTQIASSHPSLFTCIPAISNLCITSPREKYLTARITYKFKSHRHNPAIKQHQHNAFRLSISAQGFPFRPLERRSTSRGDGIQGNVEVSMTSFPARSAIPSFAGPRPPAAMPFSVYSARPIESAFSGTAESAAVGQPN
ncbi:hypothetical protein Trydic_g20114 [Trypoxylus dichotomus]